MTQPFTLTRRAALQRVAVLLGGSLSAPAVLGVLNGCSASPPAPGWQPRSLSDQGLATVAAITDIMIPATDTPGALNVGVPAFIDGLLTDVYPLAERERYLAGLEAFRTDVQRESGTDFLELPAEQQYRLVRDSHDAAVDAQFPAERRPFILHTKELALLGYFTSEPGATLVLQYQAIPGAYVGCQPLAQAGNGRTWATEKSLPF